MSTVQVSQLESEAWSRRSSKDKSPDWPQRGERPKLNLSSESEIHFVSLPASWTKHFACVANSELCPRQTLLSVAVKMFLILCFRSTPHGVQQNCKPAVEWAHAKGESADQQRSFSTPGTLIRFGRRCFRHGLRVSRA